MVAAADVDDLALTHQVIHRPENLIRRRIGVEAVLQIDVDAIGLQALQTALNFAHDVVAGQTGVVRTRANFGEDLARDYHVVAPPLERSTENLLGAAEPIEVRAVDEVAAQFQRTVHDALADGVVFLAAESRPQTDARNLDSRFSQSPVFHFSACPRLSCGYRPGT